jgi:hypothetical protein
MQRGRRTGVEAGLKAVLEELAHLKLAGELQKPSPDPKTISVEASGDSTNRPTSFSTIVEAKAPASGRIGRPAEATAP